MEYLEYDGALRRLSRTMACSASMPPTEDMDPKIWGNLPREIVVRILERLPPNEFTCTARLVCRAAARQVRAVARKPVVHLSEWTPPTEFAAQWQRPGATLALSLRQRRRLVALVAASGVVPNLRVAAEAAGCLLTSEVVAAAAAAGQVGRRATTGRQPCKQSCDSSIA